MAINVRGVGPEKPEDADKPWHGLPEEDPARTVLADVSTLVGPEPWANFSLTDLSYEAIKVDLLSSDWYLSCYDVSRKDGEGIIGLLLSALKVHVPRRSGAHRLFAGRRRDRRAAPARSRRAPQGHRGRRALRRPRFNPSSRAAKGSFNPTRSGIPGGRPEFPSDVAVASYCRSLDPVCQGLVGYRVVWSGIGGTVRLSSPRARAGITRT